MGIWKRLLLSLAVVATMVGFVQLVGALAATGQQPGALEPVVLTSNRNDTSRPLREIAAEVQVREEVQEDRGEDREGEDGIQERPLLRPPKVGAGAIDGVSDGSDPAVVQNRPGLAPDMPLPILNFEGVGNRNGVLPPDTQGDIGYDPSTGTKYYMQWNNLSLAVWDVTDPANATLEWGPVDGNALFDDFGGVCETTNDGDPIVLFDHVENRWMASQFALPNFPNGPFYQCIAVSESAAPIGSWHRYEFQWPVDKMNDYPKFGVWPDAYYITANQFNAGSLTWGGAGVGAFEKAAMMDGAPATFVYFDLFGVNSEFGGVLPADLDGDPPPAGTPGYFAEWDDSAWLGDPADTIRIWEFHVDFDTPANSTFGLSGLPNDSFATADVDPNMCNYARNCVPQPGGTDVDAISDRLMHRLVYRYHQDGGMLLANHTVDADGTDHAGIHWLEMRESAGDWSLYQEGVYAPDSEHRWMGSIAMDHAGNIALGYSVSSESTFPSIRYAGRLADDPLGTLAQAEEEIIAGSGYQEHSSGRWGDYSMMGVDPVDGCTFWYTSEYYETIGTAPWQTRIASFKYPNCTVGPTGTLQGTVDDGTVPLAEVQIQADLSVTQTYGTATESDGTYELALPTGTYTVTASKYRYVTEVITDVEVVSGTVATQNITLDHSRLYTVDGTVTDGNTGWPLYAAIEIDGYPDDPVWTDPETGTYSIVMAEGITYTFDVVAWAGGYLPASREVGPLTGDVTEDFALDVDGELCAAPGYGYEYAYFEDFEAGDGGYTANAVGEWEWGAPTYPAGLTAYSGANVWGTDLDDYAADDLPGAQHILTATLTIPANGGLLTWWDWFGDEASDERQLYVDGAPVWDDDGGTDQQFWMQHTVDLRPWAGITVDVEFILDVCCANPGPDGWYIDDVGIIALASDPPAPPVMDEDFEGPFPPAGWTAADLAGTGNVWDRNDVFGEPNETPGSGFSAAAQGDYDAGAEDTTLTTPPVDLSGMSSPELTYNSNFQDFAGNGEIWLHISGDGGATWTELRYQSDDDPSGGTSEVEDISAWAGETVQLRFWYSATSGSAWYWHVDDVVVRESPGDPETICSPQEGGLVVGTVYDENTLDALNDATVSNDAGYEAMTWSTPNDDNVGDGFYTVFSPAGSRTFTGTVENGNYGVDEGNVTVVQSDTVSHDFYLPAGMLSPVPNSFSAVLDFGESASADVRLFNTGGVDTSWEVTELDGDRVIRGPFEQPDIVVKSFKQSYSSTRRLDLGSPPPAPPYDAGDVIRSWAPSENANPWGVVHDANADSVWVSEGWGDNHIDEYTPAGAFTGATWPFPWSPSVGPADAAYNWNTGTIWVMNVATGTSNCIYEIDPANGYTGNIICPGGGTGFSTSQRGLAYDPTTDTYFAGGWNDEMVYRFASDGTMLASVDIGLGTSGLAYNPDTMHLFAMVNASPNPVYVLDVADNYNIIGQFSISEGFGDFAGAGLEIDCDGELWAADQDTGMVYEVDSGETTSACARGVPWLSSTPESGIVPIDDYGTVEITLDASVAEVNQPGDYYATLQYRNDTPYGDVNIPVTMTVNVPAAWGKLGGVVTGLERCDAPGDPLEGATVIIAANDRMMVTVETDGDGEYGWWMDAAAGTPVSISVSAPGYADQRVGDIVISAGVTTTQDVDLRLDVPCASQAPDSLSATVYEGTAESVPMTITNSGAGDLVYNIMEWSGDRAYGPRSLPERTFATLMATGPSSILADAGRGGRSVPAPTALNSSWYAGVDIPVGVVRYGHAQCYEFPNSFYVISGVDDTFALTDQVWRYDAETNSWTELAPIPTAAEGPTATCYRGRIYVMGGSSAPDALYIYDIATDTWMTGASLPAGTAGGAAAAWNGTVYLAGGDEDFTPSTGVHHEIWTYDISSDSWSRLLDTLAVPTTFPGYVQAGQYLYMVGGWGELAPDTAVTLTQRLDMASGTVETGPVFDGRSDLALGATMDALYAIGGDADGGGFFDASDAVTRYDLSAWPGGGWEEIGEPLPAVRTANSAGYCTSSLFSAELRSVGGSDGVSIFTDNRFLGTDEVCHSVYEDVPWLSEVPAAGTIGADMAGPVGVIMDADGMAPGTYTAGLLVQTNDPPANRFEVSVTMTVLEATQGVVLFPVKDAMTGAPGETVAYTVMVTNTGTVTDTFALVASGNSWPTSVQTSVTLGPGEGTAVTVEVAIPATAAEGDTDAATITATSQMNGAVAHRASLLTQVALRDTFLPAVFKE